MSYKLLGFKPSHPCASGTTHTGGAAISAAIRDQHTTALRSYPAYARSRRTAAETAILYRQAMIEKRNRKGE
jgi:hypothetical protein